MVKCLPTMWETRVWSLGREDPLEKEMAPHSSTPDWEIPWTEECGGLRSMRSQRAGHNWASMHACMKAVIGKIILCWIGNGNDLKHESIGPAEEINQMLSGDHVRFFPYYNNGDSDRSRKTINLDFEDIKHMQHNKEFFWTDFLVKMLSVDIKGNPDLGPRFFCFLFLIEG